MKLYRTLAILSLAGILFASGCATLTIPSAGVVAGAGIVVTADGVGTTQHEALTSALQHAVQRAGKTLVVTDRTVSDRDLKDVSASFSAGIVNDYAILDVRVGSDGLTRVVVRATVSESILRSRLAISDGKTLDGSVAHTALSQEIARADAESKSQQNRQRGAEQLLKALLAQVPAGAIDVSPGEVEAETSYGNTKLLLKIRYHRNRSFFSSLEDTLKILGRHSKGNSREADQWLIMPAQAGDIAIRVGEHFLASLLRDMFGQEVRERKPFESVYLLNWDEYDELRALVDWQVMVRFLDEQGLTVFRFCERADGTAIALYDGKNKVKVNSALWSNAVLSIRVTTDVLGKIRRAKRFTVTPVKSCSIG